METAAVSSGGPRTRPAGRAYADALLHLCGLSIVAGGIHAVVAAPHLAEYWPFGAAFAVLATVQLAWGAWIYARPSPLGMRGGIAISLGVIAIWIASRTVGLPLGPEHWEAEGIGPLDLAASANEALIAVLGGAFLATARDARRPAATLPSRFRLLGPLAMLAMAAGLLGLLLGGGHHAR